MSEPMFVAGPRFGAVVAILQRQSLSSRAFDLVHSGVMVGRQTMLTTAHGSPGNDGTAARWRLFSQVHGIEPVAGSFGNPFDPEMPPKIFYREQVDAEGPNRWANDWGVIAAVGPLEGVTPYQLWNESLDGPTEAAIVGFGQEGAGFQELHEVMVRPCPAHPRLAIVEGSDRLGGGDSGSPVLIDGAVAGVYHGTELIECSDGQKEAHRLAALVGGADAWWQVARAVTEFRPHLPSRSLLDGGSPSQGVVLVEPGNPFEHSVLLDDETDLLSVTVTGLSPDRGFELQLELDGEVRCRRKVRSFFQTIRYSAPSPGKWVLRVTSEESAGGRIQMVWSALQGRRPPREGCYEPVGA